MICLCPPRCGGFSLIIPFDFKVSQVARVRLHGFSEREISIVRALMMSEIESAFLERDQMQSTSLRDEYLQVLSSSFFFFLCVLKIYTACLVYL